MAHQQPEQVIVVPAQSLMRFYTPRAIGFRSFFRDCLHHVRIENGRW